MRLVHDSATVALTVLRTCCSAPSANGLPDQRVRVHSRRYRADTAGPTGYVAWRALPEETRARAADMDGRRRAQVIALDGTELANPLARRLPVMPRRASVLPLLRAATLPSP